LVKFNEEARNAGGLAPLNFLNLVRFNEEGRNAGGLAPLNFLNAAA
jgi:hypothetical protein